MTIHVLTPVHNRCALTENFLDDLYSQEVDEDLRIVIVDDGSSDGTGVMLVGHAQSAPLNASLTVIQGDGSWWWARSMAAAIDDCRKHLEDDDVVVFMNDDISVPCSTLAALAQACRQHSSIVAASVRDVDDPSQLLRRGALLDPNTLKVEPLSNERSPDQFTSLAVASGRSVAYPATIFKEGLNVDHRHLPHHLADLEFSVRASRRGHRILLAEDIHVLSKNNFSSSQTSRNLWLRLTHISSSGRLLSHWAFWKTVLPELPSWHLASRFIRVVAVRSIRSAIRLGVAWFARRSNKLGNRNLPSREPPFRNL